MYLLNLRAGKYWEFVFAVNLILFARFSWVMSKLCGISQKVLWLQFIKQAPNIRRYISSLTLQKAKLCLRHVRSCNPHSERIKRFILTSDQCLLQCFSNINSSTFDPDTECKKFNEVVKNHNLMVPSFGGSVSANSPVDITVRSII